MNLNGKSETHDSEISSLKSAEQALSSRIAALSKATVVKLPDCATAHHKIDSLRITRFGPAAMITGYLECVYAKTGAGNETILSNASIPDPASGDWFYLSTESGILAIDGGKIVVTGSATVHARDPFTGMFIAAS